MIRSARIDLSISKAEARNEILDNVDGVTCSPKDGQLVFKTNQGVVVATLKDSSTDVETTGSTLRYRTSPVTPTLAHTVRKGKRIKRVLEPYRL